MSERSRRKQDRRARRKRKQREQSIKTMALVRGRALGCTCRAEATVVTLPIGRSVYIQHERDCPRWQSIRIHRDITMVTGRLWPVDDGSDA